MDDGRGWARKRRRRRGRPRVRIAGGGLAGWRRCAALRALAGDRVDITIVSPKTKFINASMARPPQ
jgi:hypothetical protein